MQKSLCLFAEEAMAVRRDIQCTSRPPSDDLHISAISILCECIHFRII